MSIIANETLESSIDAAKLTAFVSKAQSAYKLYKTAAMESAANCYLLWHFAASEVAGDFARAWFDAKLDDYNAEVDRFNNALPDLEARVAAYLAGDSKDISAEEFAKIEDYLGYSKTDWDKANKLKAEARDNASPFTIVVKFVFAFDRASDASNVSRYAKVLEYIDQHRDQLESVTEDAVIALLKKAGGFEAALDIARGNDPNAAKTDGGNGTENGNADNEAKRDAKVAAIKKAIELTEPLETIDYDAKFARDGYVFMVGHKQNDKVSMIGELDVSANEAKALVLKVDTEALAGLDPMSEFVAKVCEISSLVREGKSSIYTVDGSSSGEKHKVTRAFALCDDERGTHLHVSGRYTDTSAVIVARPAQGINIGQLSEPGRFLMLPTERGADDNVTKTGKDLIKQLGSIGDRVMFGMEAVDDIDTLIWQVVPNDKPLEDCANDPRFVWECMANHKHIPVGLDEFSPKVSGILAKAKVQEVHEEYVCKWAKAKEDEKKTFLPIIVSSDGRTLTFEHEKHKTFKISHGGTLKPIVTVLMRPRDIADLFALLVEQNSQDFVLSIDPKGLFHVGWYDKYGEYRVYLPTLNDKGVVKDRCLTTLTPAC